MQVFGARCKCFHFSRIDRILMSKKVQAIEGPRGIVATGLGHLHNAMMRYAVYLYVLGTSQYVNLRGSLKRSLFSSSHMCGLCTERLAHLVCDYPGLANEYF